MRTVEMKQEEEEDPIIIAKEYQEIGKNGQWERRRKLPNKA